MMTEEEMLKANPTYDAAQLKQANDACMRSDEAHLFFAKPAPCEEEPCMSEVLEVPMPGLTQLIWQADTALWNEQDQEEWEAS